MKIELFYFQINHLNAHHSSKNTKTIQKRGLIFSGNLKETSNIHWFFVQPIPPRFSIGKACDVHT